MHKNRNRNKLQRDSLRKSLTKREPISPEAGVDVSELGRSAAIKIYKRRWLVLLLYIMFVFGTKIQWIQYTVILNVVVEFFQVSSMAVKATAMIYSVSFVVSLYPMTWLIHKKGLRFVCILASASICIGTWIKYFAVSPDQFSLILIGQCFIGAWQLCVVSLPATMAATWFGPDEVATAVAIGNAGTVFGIALSAILGPIIVTNHVDKGDIGKDLNHYTLPLGFYTSCTCFLMFFFFTNGPKLPPSKSRALQQLCVGDDFEFFKYVRRLVKNINYLVLWNAHGFIAGGMIAINVSINTLYMRHFKNGEKDTGILSLLLILVGFVGSVTCARILDRFKIFKIILVVLSVTNILVTLAFIASLYFEIRWAVFLSIAAYGFITNGYYTISFESCAEITYPEPVTICVTFLNLANQIYSTVFVACIDKLIISYSDNAAYGFIIAVAIVGCIFTCVLKDERRREAAGKLE